MESMENVKVHKSGGESPNWHFMPKKADKVDEIRKQANKFKVGIALVGSDSDLSEASKLVVLNDLSECIPVSTTFVSGGKDSLKTQLHKIVDDLVDAL